MVNAAPLAARLARTPVRPMTGAIVASVVLHVGVVAFLWHAQGTGLAPTVEGGEPTTVMLIDGSETVGLNDPVPTFRPAIPQLSAPTVQQQRSSPPGIVRSSPLDPPSPALPGPGGPAAASTTEPVVGPSPVTQGVAVPDTPALPTVPQVLVPPDLRYPPGAYADGRSGSVDVRVFVAADGTVVGTQVLRADPPGLFDQSASLAFYQARFAPWPAPMGAPVVAHFDAHVDYSLPPDGEAAGAPNG